MLVSSIFEFTHRFSDLLALIVIHRIRLLLPATLLSEFLIFTVDHFYFFQNCAVETADVELFLAFLKVCIELVMAFLDLGPLRQIVHVKFLAWLKRPETHA